MREYDYIKRMKRDILGFINSELDTTCFENEEALEDYLNESFYPYDLMEAAYDESGYFTDYYDPEAIDATFEYYLLPEAIHAVLSENEFEFKNDSDEDYVPF